MNFLKDLDGKVNKSGIPQWIYKAPNSNFGASIVQIQGVQGYELVLINFDDKERTSINWDYPELGGVSKDLTEQEVNDLLVKISEL